MTGPFDSIGFVVRRSSKAIPRTRRIVGAVFFIAACRFAFIHPALAAECNIASSDEAGLIAAINEANRNDEQ